MTSPLILIVEEDGAERADLERLLRDLGQVESAASGPAALMRMGMTDYKCIVLASPIAVEFGGDESTTLIELLERMAPNLASRLIVITDLAEADVIRRARELGVHELFLRPFDAMMVRDRVAGCLSRGSTYPNGARTGA